MRRRSACRTTSAIRATRRWRAATPRMPTSTASSTSTIHSRLRGHICKASIPIEERPMPTYDGGHYFLTALIPIEWHAIEDGAVVTSPVHALRKQLELLPPAAQTPACAHRQSPFAKSTRTHFARFVVIDDVAYPGRLSGNTLVAAATGVVLTDAQPQDNLNCPFLLFVVDFDAASGDDGERDAYLSELWNAMSDDLANLFRFCRGFNATDGKGFAAYIAKCQLETTMSFNDYYAVTPNLPSWPKRIYLSGAVVAGGALGLGVLATIAFLVAALFGASVP